MMLRISRRLISNSSSNKNRVVLSLYRSLLRIAKLYSFEPHGKILSSFLHRSGMDEEEHMISGTSNSLKEKPIEMVPLSPSLARDISKGYLELQILQHRENERGDESDVTNVEKSNNSFKLFRLLLSEVIASTTVEKSMKDCTSTQTKDVNSITRLMRFPCQIPTIDFVGLDMNDKSKSNSTIWDIVRREFRAHKESHEKIAESRGFDCNARVHAAFISLRELNRKLAFVCGLGYSATPRTNKVEQESTTLSSNERRNGKKSSINVSRLRLFPSSNYLQPGTFLIAHPLLNGYFAQTVICILDHSEGSNESRGVEGGGTYGLVINRRPTLQGPKSALRKILRPDCLPKVFRSVFGDSLVQDGGPVNLSVQMVYSCSPEQAKELKLGGRVLSFNKNCHDEKLCDVSSTTLLSDHAVYYGGDVIRAAQAVIDKQMKVSDFSFFVGASCWEGGQLEGEIERGWWMPVSAPPETLLCGSNQLIKKSEVANCTGDKYQEDMWLSMMCSMGEKDGKVASLTFNAFFDKDSEACDVA